MIAVQAQRPLGIDVSGYQGTNIDWVSVKNAGISFAWVKATEGITFDDDAFTVNEANAHAAGLLIGAYHFAHPDTHTSLSGADQEAAHFWTIAGPYLQASNGQLMPVLDLEVSMTNQQTVASLAGWVNQWCNDITNYAFQYGVVLKPVVYTYTSYASQWIDARIATNWLLWLAAPGSANAQTGAPSTYPWSNWAVWQYTFADTVSGVSGADGDVFNGTVPGLGQLVIGGLPTPYIFSHLPHGRVLDAGGRVSFSVSAGGRPPLHYQWTLNGNTIPNATNSDLNIVDAQASQTGTYGVIVTNTLGSDSNTVATLIVYPPQATIFEDNFDANSAANWIVNRSSSDTAVAFDFDYSALGVPSAPNSTNGTTRGLQLKANLTQGLVAAVSLSPSGQSFSGDYRLHFDGWINVNGPFPAGGSSSTEYLTAGLGTTGHRVEWTGAGSTADGYYFSASGDGGVSATSTSTGDYSAYIGSSWQNAATGIYTAGSLDNGNPYYVNSFGAGHSAPALQQAEYSQQTGSLSAGTLGLGWHDFIVSRRGSTVNWAVDGVLIATINSTAASSGNITVGFWDPFASLTDNTNLSFGLVDNVRVEVPAIAPAFTANPVPESVKLGSPVAFFASASGLPAPGLQWLFNGTPIPNATNGLLTLSSVWATNTGYYSVLASNIAGVFSSSGALLALLPPAPAVFQSIAAAPAGLVQVHFTGDANWTYMVETSSNLVDWITFTNLTTQDGNFFFTANAPTNSPAEFFRARVGP